MKIDLKRHESRLTVNTLLKDAFNRIDLDRDGKVNAMDIQRGLRQAGVRVTTEETVALLSQMDREQTGQVTFEDFNRSHEEFIHRVFVSFDESKCGYLDEDSLQKAVEKLGIAINKVDARAMITELSPSDPNQLTYDDFHDLYLLFRAKMHSSPSLMTLLWDPDIKTLSQQWYEGSTVEVGEDGLKVPLNTEKRQVDPKIRFLGGALSGVIEALILTPLDVTKTRLQLDKTARYSGMRDCATKLYRAEGPLALYKGFTPWTAHVVTKNGTRFYFNTIYRGMLAEEDGQVKGSMEFVAGAMAGATEAVLIVTPFEVVKTRLQGQDKTPGKVAKYKGPVHTALKIMRHEGPFALWKGVAPTIVRQGLNQACSFWSNSAIKKYVWDLPEGETLPAWKSVVTGMVGAVPGPCLNCPMDVIKTRLMAQENARGEAPKYRGVFHALRLIPKEEGVGALYKGLLPRLTRLCPSYGIQWLVMDQVTARFS